MKMTGKWVYVVDQSGNGVGVRMLHEDRRGRDCVRYKKQWRLVEKVSRPNKATYVLGGML